MGELTDAQFAEITGAQAETPTEPATESTPTTEAQPASAEPKPQEKDRFATRFAALAKREAKLKQRDDEIRSRSSALETQAKEFDELKSLLKSDPISALKRMGYSYDDLTRQLLGQEKTPEERIEAVRNEAIEAAREEARKAREEQEQSYQRAELNRRVDSFKRDAIGIAKAEFKLVSRYPESDIGTAALQMAQKVYNESGEVLTVRAAVERVETELRNQLQWLAEANQGAAPQAAVQAQDSRANRNTSPNTLTNSNATDVAPGKKLTRAERIKRLIEQGLPDE